MSQNKPTTAELQNELDAIIAWFESDQVDIDQATRKYQQGLELVKQLQDRLKKAENIIKKVK